MYGLVVQQALCDICKYVCYVQFSKDHGRESWAIDTGPAVALSHSTCTTPGPTKEAGRGSHELMPPDRPPKSHGASKALGSQGSGQGGGVIKRGTDELDRNSPPYQHGGRDLPEAQGSP